MGLGVRQPGKPFGGSAVQPQSMPALRCDGCGAWHDDLACPWCGRPHAGRRAGAVCTVSVRYGAAMVGAVKTTKRAGK